MSWRRTDTTQLNTDGLARRDIYVARLALESSDEYINARSHCDNEVAISVGSSFGYERWVPRRPSDQWETSCHAFDAGMSCAMAVHIDDRTRELSLRCRGGSWTTGRR